jgi:hypothetical protein
MLLGLRRRSDLNVAALLHNLAVRDSILRYFSQNSMARRHSFVALLKVSMVSAEYSFIGRKIALKIIEIVGTIVRASTMVVRLY